MPFIPHTENDVQQMLNTIGVDNIEQLFDEIPSSLRCEKFDDIPDGVSEMELNQIINARVDNIETSHCFIGAGAYEHHIPAAVWEITSRGEFLTAYTPYQAEASQGTLQLLYEFQSMMSHLTGMEVSNTSMYDGASALAESCLMAVRLNRKSKARRVLIPGALHPSYVKTVQSIVSNQNIELVTLPFCNRQGITLTSTLSQYDDQDITAVVIQQPNFFGNLEDVDAITQWAHSKNAIMIGCVNPTALGIIKEPGQWADVGADIVCGEGQPLGVPLASGGPYFGFLCTQLKHVRQMPGRLIGQTTDADGNIGYALTLQAREQHIRRSKATSNICTNQGLLVTAATLYMSLLGGNGLAQVAKHCHHNTKTLIEGLLKIDGVSLKYDSPYFHEAVIQLPCSAQTVVEKMLNQGILAGYDLGEFSSDLTNCLLICVTETKTQQDIANYVDKISQLIK